MTDDVTAAIDRAEAHLAAARAAREREFERWKRHHAGDSNDANAWIPHLDEIGRAVTAAVPGELPAEIAGDLTSVADAFLAADAANRERWTEHAVACAAFVSGHGAWLVVAQRRIADTHDAVWLRRAVAIAALACGGRDSRDEQLAFDDLVRAARAAGIDPAPEFRHVAVLASTTRSFGGSSQSVRAFLAAYAAR